MKRLKLNRISFLLILFGVQLYAQNSVSGNVTDNKGNPIPGVSVIVQGTNQGTNTDFDGNYSIAVASDQKLLFTSIGFANQIVTVGNQLMLNIVLQESSEILEEIIVTGYGTQTQRETTGAISTVK